MKYDKYIEVNPKVMVGKPVIKGTRIPVGVILNLLANGYTYEKIIAAYPPLNKKQIEAALAFAAEKLNREENYNFT
ncbi:hypothetical protein A2714_03595 [Candidatus Woesebacteria bacterium RIFCSPHIGHO2_01_FULL_38_9]|uniref:Antitoxin n=2 Tax=Candidatus Woeseibacteriota TaxID=1752722 RepID=A0A1F7Y228_9BACT|nr:MAG: hypothetical protein A2714_03595 [Candidatus Woesebacteria bacterium RIFCSPHIGHO2_01_FULL_38_9]OGM63927.1 MAG: hypothetical protein A2893_00230 [Candidatus Woesebacteria bacterium RIFCSPLOWO2_01_FULL_39_25]